ncbi:MAG TPA: hypothetical protein PLU24_05890 [Candidatus Omnitrophota bacterium]|nr:hypothetical protein [Candidatus Omnitrophota bacterium]
MKRCAKCKVPIEGVISKILGKVLRCYPSKENPALCNHCATGSKKSGNYTCQICGRTIDETSALMHVKAEEYLLNLIKKDHPEWKSHESTCHECVSYYRELIKKAKI